MDHLMRHFFQCYWIRSRIFDTLSAKDKETGTYSLYRYQIVAALVDLATDLDAGCLLPPAK